MILTKFLCQLKKKKKDEFPDEQSDCNDYQINVRAPGREFR